MWPSFSEIGEMACITPAWSSRGHTLKDMATANAIHDSSTDSELCPIDMALGALKHLKLGLSKMASAVCIYETEYEPMEDPSIRHTGTPI